MRVILELMFFWKLSHLDVNFVALTVSFQQNSNINEKQLTEETLTNKTNHRSISACHMSLREKVFVVFLPSGPMLMITEYCSHGDLLNFLRAHAQHFMASFLSLDEAEGRVFYKNMANLPLRLRR